MQNRKDRKEVVVREWSSREIMEAQKNAQKRFRSLTGNPSSSRFDSSFEYEPVGTFGEPAASYLAPDHKRLDDGQHVFIDLLIEHLVEKYKTCASESKEDQDISSIFKSRTKPDISLKDYLHRFRKYLRADVASFIYMTMNADIYVERHPDFHLNALTWHRLMLASMCLALKGQLEFFLPNNAYVAKVGGISKQELNELELGLFFGIVEDKRYCSRQFYQVCHQELLPGYHCENLRFFQPAPSGSGMPLTLSSSSDTSSPRPPKQRRT